MGVEDEVLAGTSGSLLAHPKEFNESRNAEEVILPGHSTRPRYSSGRMTPVATEMGHRGRLYPVPSGRLETTLALLKAENPVCCRREKPKDNPDVANVPGRLLLIQPCRL